MAYRRVIAYNPPMSSQPTSLSQNVEELQAIIVSQRVLLAENKAEIEHLRSLYNALRRYPYRGTL